ncbi:MAG: hypothetical protein P4L93_10210 [Coriobacteriia bacterium]|nr:hypothetical protein [Coriobacteriia bacterium]
MSDPIFPDKPLIPSAEEHAAPDKHASGSEWVVVHRGGAGSKAHVEALEHKLTKAHITSRVAHDDEHRVILEVQRDQEEQALTVLGDVNTHGAGEAAHQTREERIEESEHLHGAFAATKSKTLIWVLVFAVLLLLAGWYFVYWPMFHH